MSKSWLITDLHLEHKKIIELCNRPVNYEDRIQRHWKRLVLPEVTVYCLGDIGIGNDERFHEIIRSLPGKKILTKGNHDRKSDSWYESHGWDLCCEALRLDRFGKKILLSHKPALHVCGIDMNIHGHQHNMWNKELYSPDGIRFILALEHVNYEPVLLQAFITKCEKYLKNEFTKRVLQS